MDDNTSMISGMRKPITKNWYSKDEVESIEPKRSKAHSTTCQRESKKDAESNRKRLNNLAKFRSRDKTIYSYAVDFLNKDKASVYDDGDKLKMEELAR